MCNSYSYIQRSDHCQRLSIYKNNFKIMKLKRGVGSDLVATKCEGTRYN